MACEKCWGDAYIRHLNNPSKSQAEHYVDLLEERRSNPCCEKDEKGQFMSNYDVIDAGKGRIVKAWHRGVPLEDKAREQLIKTAELPFIFKWVASMPDAHWGCGSTIGTVLPTQDAIVPAAVGVDIGCGMMALKLDLKRADLNVADVRALIEKVVPHGRTNNGGPGDRGAWHDVPEAILALWTKNFQQEYQELIDKHPKAEAYNTVRHLGTLGTGNHFIELAEDINHMGEAVWLILHSGSRGMGNKIGSYFTDVAKTLCAKWFINLPDPDLAYLPRDTEEFDDYCKAVKLAQRFALLNRETMSENILKVLGVTATTTVQCHHNYIAWENHFGQNIMVTRKGAVRAQKGDLGIIPGSMGARTYVVRGLGNPDSFCTCSHGAGRAMGRMEAKRRFTIADHIAATEGVECLKDASVLDETPAAYKSIEAVMAAQSDLVETVAILKQFVCVKGGEEKSKH